MRTAKARSAATPIPRRTPAETLLAVLRRLAANDRQEDIAKGLAISRARVANLARLRNLPPAVLDRLKSGALSTRAGEELIRLREHPARMLELAERCVERGTTTLELRAQVDAVLGIQRVEPVFTDAPLGTQTADSRRLAQGISEWLAAPVVVTHESSGRGELRIRYHSVDELEGILERIGYSEG